MSTYKQKHDLVNQISLLEEFCAKSGLVINKSFSDIGSGIDFSKRKQFMKLLDLVETHKIEKVVITHKDRLSRVGFDMFKSLFEKHGCQIIVMSEVENEKTDEQEIFEEIISLLHCFSMRMYSKRRRSIRKILRETGANVDTTTIRQRKVHDDKS